MPRRKVAKLRTPTESESQIAFFARVRMDPRTRHLPIFHIPNGGARHIVTAKKLKAEGVCAGVPDIFCAVGVPWVQGADGCRNGLFIEMKRKGNKPTPDQMQWISTLVSQHYQVSVCYGADAAWSTLCEYLGFPHHTVAP